MCESGHFSYSLNIKFNFMYYYVYLIQSINYPKKIYVGYTNNLKERIKGHNEGKSNHTRQYMPWQLMTYLAFDNQTKAVAFEKYLKSGSGRAFAIKRL